MTAFSRIVFLHEGKAAYPEVEAYRRYFEGRFAVEEARPADLAGRDLRDALLWCVMGFYPRRFAAAATLHDYRSLSIGRFAALKDKIKSALNAKPDLRLFQNEAIESAFGFRDGVPRLLLPMGVPEETGALRRAAVEPVVDFTYAGVLSFERKIETMIESFLRRYGASKSLALYGRPEPALCERFKAHANVRFEGFVPQAEVFARLRQSRAAVCYFPNHFPHLVQTPTKLLDYAALGLRIAANEHPASRAAASAYGIRCAWGPSHDMFAPLPDALTWDDNATLDPSPFFWPSLIRASGIDAALESL